MRAPRVLAGVLLALLAAVSRGSHADEWPTPQTVRLRSPQGRWEATLVPSTDGQAPARATVRAGQAPATTFPLRIRWMPVDAVLLDDGRLITFDEWHRLGAGEVVVAHGPDGRVLWSRTLEALVGQARVAGFRRSVSSTWWRATPLVWSLVNGGTALSIRLADENQLQIRLHDGAATAVRVESLPDDPVRLANRAEALTQQGRHAEAAALLQRALRLKPADLALAARLVETLQQLGRHPEALRAGSAAAAAAGRAGAAGGDTQRANLLVLIATSQRALGQLDEAEASLKEAVQVAPLYDHPGLRLAELLRERGRSDQAFVVLEALAGRAAGTPNGEYTLASVGDFLRRAGELARARACYLRAFRADRVTNQFLYQALAEVHEALGEGAKALGVYRQLLRHFEMLGTPFRADAERARQNVARLDHRDRARPR